MHRGGGHDFPRAPSASSGDRGLRAPAAGRKYYLSPRDRLLRRACRPLGLPPHPDSALRRRSLEAYSRLPAWASSPVVHRRRRRPTGRRAGRWICRGAASPARCPARLGAGDNARAEGFGRSRWSSTGAGINAREPWGVLARASGTTSGAVPRREAEAVRGADGRGTTDH